MNLRWRIVEARPFLRWYDLWIGAYWDRRDHALYLCPLPCVGIKLTWRMSSRRGKP